MPESGGDQYAFILRIVAKLRAGTGPRRGSEVSRRMLADWIPEIQRRHLRSADQCGIMSRATLAFHNFRDMVSSYAPHSAPADRRTASPETFSPSVLYSFICRRHIRRHAMQLLSNANDNAKKRRRRRPVHRCIACELCSEFHQSAGSSPSSASPLATSPSWRVRRLWEALYLRAADGKRYSYTRPWSSDIQRLVITAPSLRANCRNVSLRVVNSAL